MQTVLSRFFKLDYMKIEAEKNSLDYNKLIFVEQTVAVLEIQSSSL